LPSNTAQALLHQELTALHAELRASRRQDSPVRPAGYTLLRLTCGVELA